MQRETFVPPIALAALVTMTAPALAADGPTIEARGGVGYSSMLSQPQRDRGYRSGFVPDLRPGLRVDDLFLLELEASSWFFPHDGGGTGRATMFGGGLRCDPRMTSWLTWFVDAHGGVALTGPSNRPALDAATGVDVWVTRNLAVGPYIRYGQVFDSGPDPQFWAVGLGLSINFEGHNDEPPALGPADPDRERRQQEWERARREGHTPSRYRDRDNDGIPDEQDICPDEKPGPHPDPNMLGCPAQEHPSPP